MTLTCAVDNTGRMIIPCRINKSVGFESLKTFITNNTELNTFVRSRKPYLYRVGDFALVADGTLIFNKAGELIGTKDFGFYVPVTVVNNVVEFSDKSGNINPGLACEKLANTDGLNVFKVTKEISDAYMISFLNSLDRSGIEDKEIFLRNLLR